MNIASSLGATWFNLCLNTLDLAIFSFFKSVLLYFLFYLYVFLHIYFKLNDNTEQTTFN